MAKKKVIVTITGATGRLGVAVVKALEKKFSLRLLARNEKKARRLFPRGKIVKIDLENASVTEVKKAVRGSDAVIHLAGLVNLCASSGELNAANVEVTRKVVFACEVERIRFFLHCSSISVYADSDKTIYENSELAPATNYGKSKLAAEQIVKTSKLQWIIPRPGMIYGPHFKEGFADLIQQMKDKRLVIVGNGENKIPLVYEQDVAKAFEKCISLLQCGSKRTIARITGNAFNIVGVEPTQMQCYAELSRVFNLPFPMRRVPLGIATVAARVHSLYCAALGRKKTFPPEYVELLSRNRVFDTEKAKKLLDFTASTPLRSGIKAVKKAWKI